MVLKCHNESSYNPLVPRRIGLLCLEPAAQGGESLLVRNEDLTAAGPKELFDFIREHGGLQYKRVFHDKLATANPVRCSHFFLITLVYAAVVLCSFKFLSAPRHTCVRPC